MNHEAIYASYSNIISIIDEVCFDINGNEVVYNKELVEAKLVEMQAAEEAAKQAELNAKNSALNKLTALGLTLDEITALVGA
jgi:hypothetical protein